MVDARLIRELFDNDPQFVNFAKNVVGANSPEDFVQKMSPDVSAVHVPGGNTKKVLRRPKIQKSQLAARLAAAGSRSKPATVPPALTPGYVTGTRSVTVARGKPKKLKKPAAADAGQAGGNSKLGYGVAAGLGAAGGYGVARGVDSLLNPKESYAKSVDGYAEFSKVDSDKRQVFGWASITHVNGDPVVDRQGDVVTLEEVEKSAYDYVVKSRVGGSQHKRDGDKPFHAADLIESFVVTEDKAKAMGLGDNVPQGWWVGFKVNDDNTWDKVKNGDVTGFSVHGRGKRQQIDGELTPSEVVDG